MIDEFGRTEHLVVLPAHRPECRFGPGFFRVCYQSTRGKREMRYAQDADGADRIVQLLHPLGRDLRVERDGYCLDNYVAGDANTPDVVDAEWWLGLDVNQGMRELGLKSEDDYRRTYHAVEAAVLRRDNRASQLGVRASIVIKRAGAKVTDVG